MKINVVEEKVDFEEKELEIKFPFYYQMELSNDDESYKHLYTKVTEDGKIVKIVEICLHDEHEIFTIDVGYIDLEDLDYEDELNLIFQNEKNFELSEEEYSEIENRFLNFVNENFKNSLFAIGTN